MNHFIFLIDWQTQLSNEVFPKTVGFNGAIEGRADELVLWIFRHDHFYPGNKTTVCCSGLGSTKEKHHQSWTKTNRTWYSGCKNSWIISCKLDAFCKRFLSVACDDWKLPDSVEGLSSLPHLCQGLTKNNAVKPIRVGGLLIQPNWVSLQTFWFVLSILIPRRGKPNLGQRLSHCCSAQKGSGDVLLTWFPHHARLTTNGVIINMVQNEVIRCWDITGPQTWILRFAEPQK